MNYHKNGEKYWVRIQGHPIYNEAGEVTKFFAIEEDITTRVHTEQALRNAKERADASAAAKNNFLANMSHEMRTPLNVILGMGEQLRKLSLEPRQRLFLDTMKTAAENLLIVINDILDISRIEAGKINLESIDFEASQPITKCLSVLAPKAEEKGLDFHLTIDAQVSPVLVGDPHRLNQVLLNLAGNAIKFTEKGSVIISADVLEDHPDHQLLRFMVTDTGTGIEDKFLRKIFNKFTQEDSSILRKFGGTGLGLNICKQLVELMGGSIHVKSRKNIGSTFWFDISLPKGNPNNLPKNEESHISPDILHSTKVLVVEDNEMNRLLAKTVLIGFGATIAEAENGEKAVQIITEEHFDVILMDLQMPVMDGFEATRHIRQKLDLDTPIIALTANALKGEQEKCLAEGMNAYITKPFKENELISSIAKLTGINTSAAAIAPTDTIKALTAHEDRIYDLEYLYEIGGDSDDFVKEMLGVFMQETARARTAIPTLFAERNLPALKAGAHKFKANVAMVNCHSLRQVVQDIENTAENGGPIEDLEVQIRKFDDVLKVLLGQLYEDLGLTI